MDDDKRERLAHSVEKPVNGRKIAAQLRADGERIKALEAERDRLRDGIQAFLDGDVERPVKTVFRADGKPSKQDLCPHGVPMYEGYEGCADAYFEALLNQKGQ